MNFKKILLPILWLLALGVFIIGGIIAFEKFEENQLEQKLANDGIAVDLVVLDKDLTSKARRSASINSVITYGFKIDGKFYEIDVKREQYRYGSINKGDVEKACIDPEDFENILFEYESCGDLK